MSNKAIIITTRTGRIIVTKMNQRELILEMHRHSRKDDISDHRYEVSFQEIEVAQAKEMADALLAMLESK